MKKALNLDKNIRKIISYINVKSKSFCKQKILYYCQFVHNMKYTK